MAKGTGLNLDESDVVTSAAERDSKRFSIKRNAVSVTCTVPIDGGDDEVFQGTLEDISNTGLSMSSRYPLEKGARLEFAFDFEGTTQVREGEVMWVRTMGVLYKTGARFIAGEYKKKEITLEEGVYFPVEYRLNAGHSAWAKAVKISNSGITFACDEILALGTMVEVVIDPWLDKEAGIFNISFVETFKVSDNWVVWDMHKVAKVAKAKQIELGIYHIEAHFVADKRR